MPTANEVIEQLGGIIDTLNARLEAVEQERDEARQVARELLNGLPETARIWQYDWRGDYPWLKEKL